MEKKLKNTLKKNLLVYQSIGCVLIMMNELKVIEKYLMVIYIVKMVDDARLEDEFKKSFTMPFHLDAFALSNSKRNMNKFIRSINGFYANDVFYTDTDPLYFQNKHWDSLNKAGLVDKRLLEGKNGYKDGGIVYGLFQIRKKSFVQL